VSRPRQRRHNHADLDLGAEAGAIDTGSYWAHTTRQTKRDAKRGLELAKLLDHDHEPVRNAMAIGQAGGVWTPLVVVTMTLEKSARHQRRPNGTIVLTVFQERIGRHRSFVGATPTRGVPAQPAVGRNAMAVIVAATLAGVWWSAAY
jgi:hypothetical protein